MAVPKEKRRTKLRGDDGHEFGENPETTPSSLRLHSSSPSILPAELSLGEEDEDEKEQERVSQYLNAIPRATRPGTAIPPVELRRYTTPKNPLMLWAVLRRDFPLLHLPLPPALASLVIQASKDAVLSWHPEDQFERIQTRLGGG